MILFAAETILTVVQAYVEIWRGVLLTRVKLQKPLFCLKEKSEGGIKVILAGPAYFFFYNEPPIRT